MSVRNPLKAGHPVRVVIRKCPAPPALPMNPPPLSDTRRARQGFEKAKARTPALLLKGKGKRPHFSSGGNKEVKIPGGAHFSNGHNHSDAYTKMVPLTRAYKRNKQ